MPHFLKKLIYRFNAAFDAFVWVLIIGCAPFPIILLMMAMVQNIAPGNAYSPGFAILFLPFLYPSGLLYLIALGLFLFLLFVELFTSRPSSAPAGYRVNIMPVLFKLSLLFGAVGGAVFFILMFKSLTG